mmetsp:Transcript_649/g.1015  ORF Transcript_649/g.1015 Transcript_649/m.1015 type:complete len:293 (-) Transcript_649:538-1416(-)
MSAGSAIGRRCYGGTTQGRSTMEGRSPADHSQSGVPSSSTPSACEGMPQREESKRSSISEIWMSELTRLRFLASSCSGEGKRPSSLNSGDAVSGVVTSERGAELELGFEAAAAAAAAEKAANGEDEDHDTRRLKYPDRLRLVMKNKEEGTELFQGQNWRPAAARYNKALTHAAKFVDLSPEQREEVNAVKLSLHLNIAQCWLKITDAENHLTQAIRSCDEALELDPNSVKALYRRAFAKEAKGDYDGAKADLKKAGELAPDDTAVPKLMARVDAQLARQKAKEKKMYGKMFG